MKELIKLISFSYWISSCQILLFISIIYKNSKELEIIR